MAKVEFEFTKYEQARVIGARALQLAMGAPPLVDVEKTRAEIGAHFSPVDLAKAEFVKGLIPMHVLRRTA
mgnify:CR=1 FL=1